MQYFPLNMKLSYNQRLDIQLFIRHQFQSQKFKRHWIYCQGYQFQEQNKILKTYLSFVNQGDLYHVKTSNCCGKWKEKTFQDMATLLEKQKNLTLKKHYKLNLKKQFLSIQQEINQKQYDQLLVVTIFISQTISQRKIKQFVQFAQSFESSPVILNLFLTDKYVQNILSSRTWLRLYSQQQLKQEIRGLFGTLSKTTYKTISIQLKCLDGNISINQSSEQIAHNSWKAKKESHFENQYISNTVFFPTSNSPYIMSVEIKSLLKQQMCRFEVIMICEDQSGNINQMVKNFSLKPTKQFLNWTEKSVAQNENQPVYRYQQLSLSFEQVNLNQKLNFMKIIGTPVRVLLKDGNDI